MKKICFTVLASLICSIVFAQADSTSSADSMNTATVYVFRSTGHVGSAVNLRILVNDSMYCKIKNNRFTTFQVPAGDHIFYSTSWDSGIDEKLGLKISVAPGGTYYLSIKMKQRFFKNEIFVEEITNNTAAPYLKTYKQDSCHKKN